MKNSVFSSTNAMIMAALGIVINIVLGTIVQTLQIPLLFLDTIGTIFVASIFGPWAGALTGGLTNIIQSMITNPKDLPFALVNIAIGIIVGLVAKRWKFDLKVAGITGFALAIIAPLIGTPIAVWVYGGLTGGGTDLIFAWLLKSGQKIFTAAFIPRITGNFIDKIASCLLVAVLIEKLPKDVLKGQVTKGDIIADELSKDA
ncbi:energy-coupling factor transport system substrate-specific component [Geosporobacter subterraneus DSM 17957]|uniref:Energy-coupling factor transport system substrate-specific component n=1 Tax=Geosporobacter subterraneus DSM 17957 TaxID=1121919 RepID=A0A1M6QV63_9FIRM|nr:CD3073 family putative ECF transporter S component [Geosporobacter subterraneus]SHK24085.1 energy-coupling factor transport system substrate-specific component [Geosporobacter subterraneus DSM 17957]